MGQGIEIGAGTERFAVPLLIQFGLESPRPMREISSIEPVKPGNQSGGRAA